MAEITKETVELRIKALEGEMRTLELRYEVMAAVKHEMEQWLQFIDGQINGGLQPTDPVDKGEPTGQPAEVTPDAAPEGLND